jgi:putative two-component system response regulator
MQVKYIGSSIQKGTLMLDQDQAVPTRVIEQINEGNDSVISGRAHTSSLPIAKPKILVVEHKTDGCLATVNFLMMEGYELLEADSGEAVVELVKKKQPDLVLLDVTIPGINGFEVCQLLKQSEQTSLIPVVLMTMLDDRRSRRRGMEVGADDLLIKPFNSLELTARIKPLLQQKRLQADLEQAGNLLFSIAKAVESRDPNTGNHCERLVKLGQAFGRYLNLSPQQMCDLKWGSYLHDIGKVGIPDAVLLKKGKLTPDEWEIMQRHVIIGEEICRPLSSIQGVLPIIRHHHERWDGSGYPDQLQGDEIPYLAQVFQIMDIYDALTSERPYKKAFTPTEAIAILQQETQAGWRNPQLVQQFTEFIRCHQDLF